jgi:Methyltransferase domain
MLERATGAMPQVDRAAFDLILIDGSHNFPTVFVDFYYAARALKLGGTLVVDDLHIYTCRLAARFMRSDPGWNTDFIDNRVAFGRKISDTIDYAWTKQPFVERRSSTDRPHASLARPLVTAQIVVEMVQMQGGRVTAWRIANSVLRRVGLR